MPTGGRPSAGRGCRRSRRTARPPPGGGGAAGGPAFGVAVVPRYRAPRLAADGGEEVPPALAAQVPLIEEVLLAAGLVIAGQPGDEADDVIGTLPARSPDPVDVVTGAAR